jgi:GWxTD domain-containing protein
MNKIKPKLTGSLPLWAAAIGIAMMLNGCGGSRSLVKKLSPDHREFLSTVRYLIVKQERKAFLNLTSDGERNAFIKEFWQKRDPDPQTEVNEFKEVYFDRIDQANQLFGKNGWLSDRGRVLILLGRPETKRVFPTGMRTSTEIGEPSIYSLPMEIWYYGYYNYPIVFVDRLRSGSYDLTPLSAQHIATITRAGMILTPQVDIEKQPLDFQVEVKKGGDGSVSARFEIPYKNILFQEIKNRYEAALSVTLEMTDAQGRQLPTVRQDVRISLTAEDLQGKKDRHIIDIPLELTTTESVEIVATVESRNDPFKASKKIRFNN